MPEKLARSVVVTPCCRHHSLTERPLLRHSWICAAHSCSSARCFNSALVILTSHNTTVAKPFATFRYYCLMCVYARLGLTVTCKIALPACAEGVSAASAIDGIHPTINNTVISRAMKFFTLIFFIIHPFSYSLYTLIKKYASDDVQFWSL